MALHISAEDKGWGVPAEFQEKNTLTNAYSNTHHTHTLYTHTHTDTHTHTYTQAPTHKQTDTHTYTHSHTHRCAHIQMHTRILFMHIQIHTQTDTHTDTHTYTEQTHKYIHTQTNTHHTRTHSQLVHDRKQPSLTYCRNNHHNLVAGSFNTNQGISLVNYHSGSQPIRTNLAVFTQWRTYRI